jgi:uncharacterized RDD family membrane protein YckC
MSVDQRQSDDDDGPSASDLYGYELTPAEISAGYNSSILYRRWGATFADFGLLISYVCLLSPWRDSLRQWETIVTLPILLYYPLTEGLFGRTAGKFLMGIKVVDATGRTPEFSRILMRTWPRIFEVNPLLLGGLPAAIIVNRSRWKQRWGDVLAGTFVLTNIDAAKFDTNS